MRAITTTGPPTTRQPRDPRWPLWYVLPEMGALPTAPRTARAHVRDVLTQWGLSRFEDDAALVTSELVSNVVQAATGEDGNPVYLDGRLPLVQLSLFSDRARLLIVVYDQVPGVPEEGYPGQDAETGRGLALVGSLGTWDWHPVHGGKVVRALLQAA